MSLQTPPTQSRNLFDYIKSGLSSPSVSSTWTGYKNFLSGFVQTLPGGAVISAAGGLVGKAGNAVGRAAAENLQKPFEMLAYLEGQVLQGERSRQRASRDYLPDTIGGYTATKAERRTAGEKISPARAAKVANDVLLDQLLGRNIASKLRPSAYDPRTGKLYNIYDEAQREERFDRLGLFGNITTGLSDIVLGTVNSPAIWLGYGFKLGRIGLLDKPLDAKKVIKDSNTLNKAEAERLEYFNTKNRLDQLEFEDVTVTGRTADEVIAEKKALEAQLPKLEAKANKASEDLANVGYANSYDEFLRQSVVMDEAQHLKHRTIKESSDPEVLAGLLGENTDKYMADLIVRASSGTDLQAARLLAAESTSTFMALQRARNPLGVLEMEIKAYKQADGDVHKLSLMEENFDILKAEVDDLIKRDSFLQRAVLAAEQRALEGRTGVSSFVGVEKFRAGKAKVFGEASTVRNWDIQYFQRNPFVATVAVVSWPFREQPSGLVRVKGIDTGDSVKEIEAYMQNVSVWTGIEGANIRASYLTRYTRATNQIERENVVFAMENAAITAVAKKHGLTKAQADAIVEKWNDSKKNAIEHYKRKGYLIDENNVMLKVPQLSSQLADFVHLMDIKKLERKIAQTSNEWKLASKFTKDAALRPLELFDEFWRPAVLFRLGYPIRNVSEGWGRAAAYLGPVTAINMGAELFKVKPIMVNGKVADVEGALARWSKNRHAGLVDHFVLARSSIDARNNNRIADGLVPRTGVVGTFLAPKRVAWNRVIQMQEDSIVLNRNKIEELQNRLKDMKKKGATDVDIQNVTDDITIRQEFEKQIIVQLNEFAKQASKKGIKGNRYSVGQGYFSYGGYDNIPLAFQDDIGAVLKQLASSESTKAIEIRSAERIYGGFDSAKYLIDDYKELRPGDKTYFVSLSKAVNRQFRNSETMIRLLRGDKVEDVIAYLRTQKGVEELKLTNYTDPELYALRMEEAVKRYIPDPALRLRLSKEPVSGAELQTILGRRKDLQSIHGETFRDVPDPSLPEKYNQMVRNAFRYIGSLPEDALVRHPFTNEVYKRAIKTSIDNAEKQGIRLTPEEITKIAVAARRQSLVETRRYMYTITRYSNAAHLTRFLEPFFMAAQNTAQVWSKLVYRDPRLVGLAGYIYNAPDRAGLMQTDVNDREIVVMSIPDWMRKGKFLTKALEGQESISFEKGSANLIAQGTDWWRIGDGPIAGIAASEILKKYPDSKFTPVLNYFAPFGMSREFLSYDMALPTIPKRILAKIKGTSDRQYNNFFITATRVEDTKYRQGLRDEPTLQEIEERVNAFASLWATVAATSGLAFKFRPEYQFYIDEARKYKEKYGVDAAVRFYQDFPDYFDLYFSVSRNPSNMDPTKVAITYKKKYQNLVDQVPIKYPEFTSLLTNSYGDSPADFDNNAYSWQILNSLRTGDTEKIRQQQSPAQVTRTNNINRGWVEYGIFADKRDAALQDLMRRDRSVTSIYSKNAAGLREDKKLFVEKMKEQNPDWWDEFGTFSTRRSYRFVKFVQSVMNDKKFMAERGQAPVWDAMNEYMKVRKQMVSALKARQAAGGSANIDAKSNEGLAADWGYKIELIKKADPTGTFTSFYNRFLDTDTFEEIK